MKNRECYLCGEIFKNKKEWTKDHVPPKNLYLENNKPKNLKTLRACLSCNNKFALDEEYFLDLMIIMNAYRNPIAEEKMQERSRVIKRKPAYHQRIKKALGLDDYASAGGLYLGKIHTMSIDYERRKIITEKIIRGLHYLKYQERIEGKIDLYFPNDLYKPSKMSPVMPQTILKEPNVKEVLSYLLHHPFNHCNCTDIFNSYGYKGEQDNKAITMWAITFYNYNLSIAFI